MSAMALVGSCSSVPIGRVYFPILRRVPCFHRPHDPAGNGAVVADLVNESLAQHPGDCLRAIARPQLVQDGGVGGWVGARPAQGNCRAATRLETGTSLRTQAVAPAAMASRTVAGCRESAMTTISTSAMRCRIVPAPGRPPGTPPSVRSSHGAPPAGAGSPPATPPAVWRPEAVLLD